MINPTPTNLLIYQSATFDKTIVWRDNGEVVNMTGCHVALQVRKRDGSLVITASTMNGMIRIVEPREGKFRIRISSSVTENFDFDSAVYDLLVKDTSGMVSRIAQGEVMVSKGQTRLSAFDGV